ncbi:UNVERIFIED_CONTAM: hypothetical protein Sangu_0779700 [Sesamum angustifolium]|uniref:Uncharacterized protein n=1 Tax=Sesamum angustifolium TaxID=2727405 RepID=A0AAW2PUT9_9LAMI
MDNHCLSFALILAVAQATIVCGSGNMKSPHLCSQCKVCDTDTCPPSDAYPHMTAFDDTLIAGALQSDYVSSNDRGVYSVPNTKADADWKSINPPKKVNHHGFRFWVSHSTGKCLTVFGGKTEKRTVGVSDCEFDGSNPFQLFAFRFHYHKAFCCCGKYNE